ncbi:sensor histidine kinase [Euzebya rosea]|uniref:sensor histidine kinase n=1 Tax=Euzebya rosea TaxID=2052804 RepID=UPI00196AA91B|nr:ATP-binding protein [Euzebya rosea]
MNSGVDAALGRVAVVLRLIGAVWIVLLVATTWAAGQLVAPVASWAVTAFAVAWAVLAWRTGLIERGSAAGSFAAWVDVAVTVVVILGPGFFGETTGFAGGYPFASLVVALAVADRTGVGVAAAVLSAATLLNLFSVGTPSLPSATSNVLFYGLGASALWLGVQVLRRQEERTRLAESELAVARERATTATHLHDSVLQTLALVQRRADDAGAVRSLARRQERELREWLFPPETGPVVVAASSSGPSTGSSLGSSAPRSARSGPASAGDDDGHDPDVPKPLGRLGPTLEAHAEDMEERYGVSVRVVSVGGAADLPVPPVDEGVGALARAAREAMANAAVHAGVDTVDVFAERDGATVAVWIRDRGIGFDPDDLPADRHGVTGSIRGRMHRAGGSATISSGPSRGTEVALRIAVDGQEQP